MQFEILAIFTDQKDELNQDFVITFKSILAQKYEQWNLVIIGNKDQIALADQLVGEFNNGKSLGNIIELVSIKNNKKLDLNLAFSYLGKNLVENKVDSKLIIIKVGDYLSSDFLLEALNHLKSLELTSEYLEPKLAYADFKYLNSKQEIYNSSFILKKDFSNLKTANFLFEPKFLLRPIQFFWDISLIKSNDLKFEIDLPSYELQLAKFNLDYILTLTQKNGFLLPLAKFNPKSYYVASNQLIDRSDGEGKVWKEVLLAKKDILKKIGGFIWLKYKIVTMFL